MRTRSLAAGARGAALLGSIVAATVVATSASAHAAAPSCTLVSPAIVKSALGVTVGALKATTRPNEVYCSYTVGGVPDALHVIFDSGKTLAAFRADAVGELHAFPGAHPVTGVGDAALTYSLGSGPFGTVTLIAHKGTSQVVITAASKLAKETALARRLLG